MKKMMLKASAAVLLLTQVIAGGVPASAAEQPASKVAAAATAAPVMTDNLAKYGLKKDVELPVTVTAEGLSYTLHKIMIYDFKSATAMTLRKQYDYDNIAGPLDNPQYFIWTKITITNKSQKVVQHNYKDMVFKWRLFFANDGEAYAADARSERSTPNSKNAMFDFKLNPGQSLTTYQAFYYKGDFDFFRISLDYGSYVNKYVVNAPEIAK